MSDIIKQEAIEYDGEAKVNTSGSPILGKLSGPCADILNETRNGRKYSEELWDKVFVDPIVLNKEATSDCPAGACEKTRDRRWWWLFSLSPV